MESIAVPKTFSVAFVCSGNRFRSVIAEAVFNTMTSGLPVSVTSYGTLDLGPVGPLPSALREAEALGLDIAEHRARTLAGADLSTTSLVLTFERDHAVAAVDVAGARLEHVFILPELVLLLGRIRLVQRPDPIEQALENVARAQAGRHNGAPPDTIPVIEDPIALPEPAQRAIARVVYQAAESLAVQLFGRRR
jgi:protein-tyrosine-phosphatase